jgi:hypothetical protein
MSTWLSIGGGICVAASAVGLVISFFAWRRKGAVRGIRAIAWSLIPLVAYLTNSVLLIGRIASAIARFAGSFVFSPKSWAGVIVLGVVVVLFLTSGGLPLLNWRKARERRRMAAKAARHDQMTGARPAPGEAKALDTPRRGTPAPRSSGDDDDMSDVEAILRQRGIK